MSHDDSGGGCGGEGRFGMAPVSVRRSELHHRSVVVNYMGCKDATATTRKGPRDTVSRCASILTDDLLQLFNQATG
jgi:hypothetical protein